MRSPARYVPLVLLGAAALALACGGDSATGPSAAPVTGIVGDSQAAPTGAYTIAVSGYPFVSPGPRAVAAWGTIRAGQSFAPSRLPRKR